MTVECRMAGTLEKAFLAALLLAESIEGAEAAVLDGIAAVESDSVAGESLLAKTAETTIRRRAEFRKECGVVSALPSEVWRLFLLEPIGRDCFVLRVLAGLTPEVCTAILRLSTSEFNNTMYRALRDMPNIATSEVARYRGLRPDQDAG
jgi:hypothetical protein